MTLAERTSTAAELIDNGASLADLQGAGIRLPEIAGWAAGTLMLGLLRDELPEHVAPKDVGGILKSLHLYTQQFGRATMTVHTDLKHILEAVARATPQEEA